jgi:hypothetical protein
MTDRLTNKNAYRSEKVAKECHNCGSVQLPTTKHAHTRDQRLKRTVF